MDKYKMGKRKKNPKTEADSCFSFKELQELSFKMQPGVTEWPSQPSTERRRKKGQGMDLPFGKPL